MYSVGLQQGKLWCIIQAYQMLHEWLCQDLKALYTKGVVVFGIDF